MNVRFHGTGPSVLFLHGLPTSGRLWDRVVPAVRETFRCIVVDLPGLGESPLLADRSLDPDRYADELEDLRRDLKIASWHIVGHDAGSAIAVHYAARFGERVDRLVLCSPPVFAEHRIPWFFRLARTPVIGDAMALLFTAVLWKTGFRLSIRRRDRTMAPIIDAFRRPFRGLAGSRRFVYLLRWGEPADVLRRTAALLPHIAAPTLILQGSRDGAIPTSFATRAAAAIPSAESHILECGHFLPLSCPEAVCDHVVPFLRGATGGYGHLEQELALIATVNRQGGGEERPPKGAVNVAD